MKFIFVLLFLIPFAASALDAVVDFEVSGGQLIANYNFSGNIDEVGFSDDADEERKEVLLKFNRKVINNKLQIKTIPLENFFGRTDSPVFTHNNGNTLIYTPFFDVTHGLYKKQEVSIDNLTFRFKGNVIHKRSNEDSYERYVVLLNNPNSIRKNAYADIILDDDIPNKEIMMEKLERSLSYLTTNLGPAKERPVIFFSYSSSEDAWYDGRVIIGSPVIMMAMSKGLEKETDLYNLVLHHALLSHEIAHHWNARNLQGGAETQEESDHQAWIHEGGAEAIANLMTKNIYAEELGQYVSYMAMDNARKCETPDEDSSWEYNCGYVMYSLAMEAPGVDPWKIIKEIMELPAVSEKRVLSIFEQNAGHEILDQIIKVQSTRR